MQHRFDPAVASNAIVAQDDDAGLVNFEQIFAALHRQWAVLLTGATLGIAVAALVAFTGTPRFTASSSVLLYESNKQVVDQLAGTGVNEDESAVLSQVEILRSDGIADMVVDRLKLYEDPEFTAETQSLVGTLRNIATHPTDFSSWFAPSGTQRSTEELRQAARERVQSSTLVERLGRTYVLNIKYTSTNPTLAMQIAGALAEAYLEDQLNSKYDATRRAGDWLQTRIEELKGKSLETDLAVQKYKTDHGLIGTGGTLLSDQQLSQLNAQLVVATGDTAAARAKYERIQSIIQSGDLDGMVADALDDPVVSDLRGKYLDASKREAEIAARLGEQHEQAVRLRNEMSEYRRLTFGELSRIAQSFQNAWNVAQTRQASLETAVANATGVTATANDSLVELRELEREAETYRTLYQSFMQQYQSALQQQSFPVTDARIISPAEMPTKPSSPGLGLNLAIGAFLGLMAAGAVGGYRELRDRYFRTTEQIRNELGLECLGIVPVVKDRTLRVSKLGKGAGADDRATRPSHSITNYVVEQPLSQFAEAMRGIKVTAEATITGRGTRTIGVVSAMPGEGKSVIAANLAAHLASQGARTLLVDGDFRNPASTRALAPHATLGLAEALVTNGPIDTLLYSDQTSGLKFLPAVASHSVAHGSNLLASDAIDRLLETREFDYVILDLPPVGPVVDAKALARKLDCFVFVVEWGRTPRRVIRGLLQSEWMVAEKCLGVVLNKVDLKRLTRYQENMGASYYGYDRHQ